MEFDEPVQCHGPQTIAYLVRDHPSARLRGIHHLTVGERDEVREDPHWLVFAWQRQRCMDRRM